MNEEMKDSVAEVAIEEYIPDTGDVQCLKNRGYDSLKRTLNSWNLLCRSVKRSNRKW